MLYKRPEELSLSGKVSALSTLRLIRQAVAGMREALRGPEMAAIENGMPGLERAVVLMQELAQPAGPGVEPELAELAAPDRIGLRREILALRNELCVTGRLAHHGAAYCQGLARLLGAATGGYTPGGEGAPLQPAGSLIVRG